MTRRRFRLDSARAEEMVRWSQDYTVGSPTNWTRTLRARKLLLHWWRLGFDPALALRCPWCEGIGLRMYRRWENDEWGVHCTSCSGRGWSMPHERGAR